MFLTDASYNKEREFIYRHHFTCLTLQETTLLPTKLVKHDSKQVKKPPYLSNETTLLVLN